LAAGLPEPDRCGEGDCHHPYALDCLPTTRTVALRFKQDWLDNWLPSAARLAAQPFRPHEGWNAALSHALANLENVPEEQLALPPGVVAEQIAALFALAAGPGAQVSTPSSKLLARLKQTIRDRCLEPDLSPGAVAELHGGKAELRVVDGSLRIRSARLDVTSAFLRSPPRLPLPDRHQQQDTPATACARSSCHAGRFWRRAQSDALDILFFRVPCTTVETTDKHRSSWIFGSFSVFFCVHPGFLYLPHVTEPTRGCDFNRFRAIYPQYRGNGHHF